MTWIIKESRRTLHRMPSFFNLSSFECSNKRNINKFGTIKTKCCTLGNGTTLSKTTASTTTPRHKKIGQPARRTKTNEWSVCGERSREKCVSSRSHHTADRTRVFTNVSSYNQTLYFLKYKLNYSGLLFLENINCDFLVFCGIVEDKSKWLFEFQTPQWWVS